LILNLTNCPRIVNIEWNLFKSGQIFRAELKTCKEEQNIMVEVTEEATKQIQEYFNGKEVAPIRIFLNAGG
jgi:hypothetical protein